mmetsp:Transcript_38096/g.36457  ORF Transcript_38096/g.36457 Transcript_38096/m.36457 type:complete len:111 (-) Transcript_38096:882-1214(-)
MICHCSGALSTFCELIVFIYISSFSYYIKKRVRDPTYDSRMLSIKVHGGTWFIAIAMYLALACHYKFGLSTSLLCEWELSWEKPLFVQLLRVSMILLIPFMIYNLFYLNY